MSLPDLEKLVERLEQVAFRLERAEACPATAGAGGRVLMRGTSVELISASVQAYDSVLSGALHNYVTLSKKIGAEVATHADMVTKAFQVQRQFLTIAAKSREPDKNALRELLKPTSDQIQAVQDFREKNRTSKLFNHLSAVSESIPALGWVTISPAPAPFVKEMNDACQFYTNRVLVDYKDKDKTHIDWARSWLSVLVDLQGFVKAHHLTGLVWNHMGGDAMSLAKGSGPAPAAGGGPPPPPPPPPPADFLGSAPTEDPRAALFRDINKGENISKALKKVSAEQMTHKNPSLRGQAPLPGKGSPSAPGFASSKPSQEVMKPPRFELEGKKWCLDYQVNQQQLVVDNTQMNQSVSIYKCVNSVVIVKGKVNSISIDSCKKTSVVFDDIVSVVEFINCQSVKAQSLGKVPTIAIDKTDGAHVYLSDKSLDAEIVTSKSSEVNVSVPKADGDFLEIPVPEQYKSKWNGKTLSTIVVDQA
ncbi:adenylyl cyclase-associated protein 1-like isoform X2 [Ornithodoros turicata]|uniref:Putative adenylate cyclase-associated protein cap/srv2p n=2 Tax=Ornithodoros turicata TaxID=34597 RepID=A0A2R5LEY3_9ACAR